jgi:hypothetical protein
VFGISRHIYLGHPVRASSGRGTIRRALDSGSIGLLRAEPLSTLALGLVNRDLAKAEGEGNIRTEELRKSDRWRTFQSLRAPVDGTVQKLTLSTIAGVVQRAQALKVPIPYESAARQSAGRGQGADLEQGHRLHPPRAKACGSSWRRISSLTCPPTFILLD